ncbi:MAG TPA: hypothetical protein VIL48_07655 [Acidimicrobiales bacterium]
MSRRGWLVTAAVAALLATGVGVAAANRPDPHDIGAGERVVLYGDSLAVEAGEAFVAAVTRSTAADAEVQATPGIAPCDARAALEADATSPSPPAVAVLSFAGNNSTPCVADAAGNPLEGEALAERYVADVRAAVELLAAHDVRVVIAGPPPAPGLPGQATELIDQAYRDLVTEWAGIEIGRVRYSPAGRTVAGPDRAYAPSLPCLEDEDAADGCTDGRIVVRSPDRIHFCPSGLSDELVCPEYSSGARRYGEEMARTAAQALDPNY